MPLGLELMLCGYTHSPRCALQIMHFNECKYASIEVKNRNL